jgi:LPS O-antigen subunit length determinant protein (WzzB/FepE family)
LSTIFEEINHKMRSRALEQSTKRLDYLVDQLKQAPLASVESALAQLVEAEINKKVLIDTDENYSFEMIDPPFIPSEKSSPLRALILIMVALGVVLLELIVAVLWFVATHRATREG